MVHAHEMQDGGVEVPKVMRVHGRLLAQLIGLPMARPATNAAAPATPAKPGGGTITR